MKLYCTTTSFPDNVGRTIKHRYWDGSAADASKRRTTLKTEIKGSKPETVQVDVPTDKSGLLAYINSLG